jgi:A/G-specific adenine glycosylase
MIGNDNCPKSFCHISDDIEFDAQLGSVMSTATDRQRHFSPRQKQTLRRRLLAWYAEHARELPWRNTGNPYHVWLSEIMLQQTQVATVRGYFQRFVAKLPTVEELAAADEQAVLRLWEGLGYYRRARQLHAAAKQIVADHGGQLPQDVAALMSLPGIGRYTAGAIASIAFGQRAPILEANTIRLLSRLIAHRGDVTTTSSQKILWQVAEEILPRENVAHFNQALMELGSLVCTPTQPRCGDCPLERICAGRMSGLQDLIPAPKAKKQFTHLHEVAVVVVHGDKVLLRKCGPSERWAGLWDFPRFEMEAGGALFANDEIAEKVRKQTGIECVPGPLLTTINHGVTKYRIKLQSFMARYIGGKPRSDNGSAVEWVEVASLLDYPLCTSGRRISKLIELKRVTMDSSS